MELILTPKYKITTKQRLRHYFLFVMIFVSITIACVIAWDYINKNIYDYMLEQFIEVDEVYQSINESGNLLKQYVYSPETEQDYETLVAFNESCQEQIRELDKLAIVTQGKRNIADLQALMTSYVNSVEELHAAIQTYQEQDADSYWLAVYSEEYLIAKSILDYMYETRSALYDDAIQYIKEQISYMKLRDQRFFVHLLVVCIALLAAGILQSVDLSNTIINPITALTAGAQKIASGSLEQIQAFSFTNQENDELSFLVQVFNSMLERIRQQIDELQQAEQLKRNLLEQEVENLRVKAYLKSSELKRMQTQINSHFLFNTLSMISQTAYLENADQTIELLDSTAQFLRYSLDSIDKKVTLATELEALGNYVFLQEQRFGNRIRFYFELEEKYHQVTVPSLILQPIIENAIVHGLGMCKEGGEIRLKTAFLQTEEKLVIQITDNGVGMEDALLKNVREGLYDSKYQDSHIGLVNIYQRMQLFYCGESELRIDSQLGVGTCVELRIPCKVNTNDGET